MKTNTDITIATITANFPPKGANETNAASKLFGRPLPLFGPEGSALYFDPSTMNHTVDEYGHNHWSIKAKVGDGFITRFLTADEVAEYSALAAKNSQESADYAGSLAGQSAGPFSVMH